VSKEVKDKITKANFVTTWRTLLNELDEFGVPGKDTTNDVKTTFTPVDHKNSKYEKDSKDILTTFGLNEYNCDRSDLSKIKVEYTKDSGRLVTHLLYRVSPASLTTVEVHADYAATRVSGDTLELAKILKSTHTYGTSATKSTQLTKFTNIKQGNRPLEELMLELDQYQKLLKGNYESKVHAGYTKLEDLYRSVWLSAVDQTLFATKIDSVLENTPDAKTSDTTASLQLYSLQKGSPLSSTSDYTPTALPTTTPPVPKKDKKVPPKRSPLPGPTPVGYCEYCWSKGAGFPHLSDICRQKPKDWKPPNPKALVAEQNDKDDDTAPALLVASVDDLSLLDDIVAYPASQSIDPFAFDSCATVSLTRNISNLTDPKLLNKPIALGGIAAGAILLTHIGTLSFMPKSANTCYFSKDASHNLTSLGYTQKRGLSYHSSGKDHLIITDIDGTELDIAALSPNLLPYTSNQLLTRYNTHSTEPLTALTSTHFNAEQRMRCERAEALHQGIAIHAGDDFICEELKNGRYSWANITPRDVRLSRELRGPCPQCLEGKMISKPMPPSETAPATKVGGNIVCDIYDLKSKSIGGNLVGIRSIDEYSGDVQVTMAKSKSGKHVFEALMEKLVKGRYMKYGHSVTHFTFDAQPSMEPALPMFAQNFINLTFVDPGQSAQRMERVINYQDGRKRAVLASLNFILPDNLDPYAIKWVDTNANNMSNSRSYPTTAEIIVTGKPQPEHYKYPNLSFGDVCMVRQYKQKRDRISVRDNVSIKSVPLAELGVLLGRSVNFPGGFDFLLENGKVQPRKVVEKVNIIPFGWKYKNVHRAYLLPSDPNASAFNNSELPKTYSSNSDDEDPNDYKYNDDEILEVTDHIPSSTPAKDTPTSTTPYTDTPTDTITSPPDITPSASSSVNTPHTESSPPDSSYPSTPPTASPPVTVTQPTRTSTPQLPSTRVLRSSSKPPGFWSKAGNVATLTCDICVPASDGFEAFLCSSTTCIDHREGWLSPIKYCTPKVAFSAAVYLKQKKDETTYIIEDKIKPPTPDITKRRKVKFTKAKALTDKLTPDETRLIQAAIDENSVALLSREIESETDYYNTQQSDEVDISDTNAIINAFATPNIKPTYALVTDPLCSHKQVPIKSIIKRCSVKDLLPKVNTKCKQIPLCKAIKSHDLDRLKRSTETEVNKLQSTGCCGSKLYNSIDDVKREDPDYILVHAHVLYKLKDDNRDTCRIAGQGNRLIPTPGENRHAPVSKEGDRMYSVAAMQAHCEIRNETLNSRDYDVVGGFLNVKRTSTRRMFLKFPKSLPHPYADKYIEVFGALYGLGESNRLFHIEAEKVCIEAGFIPSSVAPMTYVKFSKSDPNKKCILNSVVDDFKTLDNDSSLSDSLRDALKKRFTNITSHDLSTTFAGIESRTLEDGGIFHSQNRYILRTAETLGVSELPPVDIPAHEDFFKELTDDELTDFDPTRYQNLTGHLIQTLKTRDDIKPFVSFLSSKNITPKLGHFTRGIHILRYLHSTPEVGRHFKSNSTEIFAHVDTAHANCPDAKSISAFFLSVGEHNAPFHSEAKSLDQIATCPMSAEYMGYTRTCQAIIHYRQLAEDLGFKVTTPTTLLSDNKTAISLTVAPEISRKSKHILVRYHYIRELVSDNRVVLKYTPSPQLRANVMTKYLMRVPFKKERNSLLNLTNILA